MFAAEFADVRPIAGVNANLIAYTAFCKPGDTVMALAIPNGGHISYGKMELGGTAGAVRGLRIEYLRFDPDTMNIDVDATKAKVEGLAKEGRTPKMVIFGASVFLFPHPMKELEPFFRSLGSAILYDSAHVLGLVAGGQFQDPLREGADLITGSTHKTFPGPQGGLVLSFNRHAEVLKKAAFPSNLSNHHLHHVAGKAVALAEFLAFGREYAAATVKNAQALASALSSLGIRVFGEKMGYTKSHQVLIDVSEFEGGGVLEKELERANIIVNRNMIPSDIKAGRHFDNPGGLRFGVQEVTRLGMGTDDMDRIAELIDRVIRKRRDSASVAKDVEALRREHVGLKYAFDTQKEAYAYVRMR